MRITRLLVIYISSVFILCSAGSLFAQDRDLHFTQYGMSPLNLNPGLTGIFNGDMRFTGNYRNQWFTVPVGYNTVSLAYDQKIYNVKLKNGLFGVGGILNYDQAGESKLRSIQLNLAGSYTQRISQKNFLTLGLSAGVAQRAFSPDDLSWDEQFVNGQYGQQNPITENFARESKFYPDFGVGLNWHFQEPNTKRTQLDFGVSLFHPLSPNISFYDDNDVKIRPRLSVQLGSSFKISKRFDILVDGNMYKQGESSALILGLALRYNFDEIIGRENAIQLGGEYRFPINGKYVSNKSDAWAPVLTYYYRQWKVGLSYDINISDFQQATNKNGGIEIGVWYIITKVKPLAVYKSCPIF